MYVAFSNIAPYEIFLCLDILLFELFNLSSLTIKFKICKSAWLQNYINDAYTFQRKGYYYSL